jgi:hypothetical protein
MIEFSKNYLYGFDTDTIDNKILYDHCLAIEKILKLNFTYTEDSWYGNFTSAINQKYNLFCFPGVQLAKLYKLMVTNISPLLDNEPYVLKSWMNVYRAGQKVAWHDHWMPKYRAWHGFYCVHVGESATHYRIPDVNDTVIVPSKEGRLVVGKSDNDTHTSTEWNDTTSCRITLAFDIIPVSTLLESTIYSDLPLNHFIPFKN